MKPLAVMCAVACLWATAVYASNQTPGSDEATVFLPYGQDGTLTGYDSYACQAFELTGYTVTKYEQTSGSVSPSVRISTLTTILAGTTGVFFTVTHGDSFVGYGPEFAAEVFEYSDAGIESLFAAYDKYVAWGYPESYLDYNEDINGAGYALYVCSGYVSWTSRANMNRVVGLIACHNWAMLPFFGGRWGFGLKGIGCTWSDMSTLFTRLAGGMGPDSRTGTAAVSGLNTISGWGNGATVLCPIVIAQSHSDGFWFASPFAMWVEFNVDMDQSRMPIDWGGNVRVLSEGRGWQTSCRYGFTVAGSGIGDGVIYVESDKALSDGGLRLNGGQFGHQILLHSNHADNGAASLVDISVADGLASFAIDGEYGTREYRIEGAHGDQGPYVPLATIAATGGGEYSAAIPPYPCYRLIEVENSGQELILADGVTPTVPTPPVEQPTLDLQALHEQSVAMVDALRAKVVRTESVEWWVLVAPQAWLTCLQPLIDYGTIYGYGCIVVTRESLPADPDACRAALVTMLHGSYQDGVTLVQFVGCDNDYDLMFGPNWPNVWTGSWLSIHDTQVGLGARAQPERQVVPAWYALDQRPRDEGMTYFAPYYSTYMPYVDVEDDGKPEMAIAVLPFATADDVILYVNKFITYATGNQPPAYVVFASGDRDSNGNSGGLVASQIVEDLVPAVPPTVATTVLSALQIGGYHVERTAAVTTALTTGAQTLVILGTTSNKDKPGDFFAPGWNPSALNASFPVYVVGATCETAGFARTHYPEYGTPLGEKFLTAQGRGAIAWAGFTAGTWQAGDGQIAEKILRKTYEDTERPLAVSAQMAIREFLDEHPDEQELAASFMFAGFVLGRLNTHPLPTDAVAVPAVTRLWPTVPNPFNASTQLQFSVAQSCLARLDIFDVRGAHIRQLFRGPASAGQTYRVVWLGQDDDGQTVSSGMYFAFFSTEERSITRKLTLLK